MEQQHLYREIIRKFGLILSLSDEVNKELSRKLLLKEQALGVELTQQLREKCAYYLTQQAARNQFECKVCFKTFDDGRKLGGHVSRAHKEPSIKEQERTRKRARPSKRTRDQEKKESPAPVDVKIEQQ